jgi:hypothetical protein
MDEIAHLRRSLLTEKSLRQSVEEENRRLRKTLFKTTQQNKPTRFSFALRGFVAFASTFWQRCVEIKRLLLETISLEDIEHDDPELIRPFWLQNVQTLTRDPELIERSKKAC